MAPRPCSTPGCTNQTGIPGTAHGLCRTCYSRYRKSAAYKPAGPPVKRGIPLADRFWSHVDRSSATGCWLWTGYKTSRGYGQIRIDGKNVATHRVAWMLAHEGKLTPEDVICHRCDTPLCCRPDHLFKGTFAVNSADMTAKGRQTKGRLLWSAKLTRDQVAEVRARYAAGGVRQVDLAREFGVSQAQISSIVRRETWNH